MYASSRLANQKFLATFGNGLFYNYWAAIGDTNGDGVKEKEIAPSGWHVPTQAEFNTLATYLGGTSVAGGKLKKTGTIYWNSPNTGATNESGFTGLGAGYRNSSGVFNNILNRLTYRSSNGYYFQMTYDSINTTMSAIPDVWGLSIRCLMDTPTNWYAGMLVYDYDGNAYTTVKIGTQVWMQSNLKTRHYNDGTVIPFAGANGQNFTSAEWAALTTPGVCSYNNNWTIVEYTELIDLAA